jgi:hypothetical protein
MTTEELAERLKAGLVELGIEMPDGWTSWDPLVSALLADSVGERELTE